MGRESDDDLSRQCENRLYNTEQRLADLNEKISKVSIEIMSLNKDCELLSNSIEEVITGIVAEKIHMNEARDSIKSNMKAVSSGISNTVDEHLRDLSAYGTRITKIEHEVHSMYSAQRVLMSLAGFVFVAIALGVFQHTQFKNKLVSSVEAMKKDHKQVKDIVFECEQFRNKFDEDGIKK